MFEGAQDRDLGLRQFELHHFYTVNYIPISIKLCLKSSLASKSNSIAFHNILVLSRPELFLHMGQARKMGGQGYEKKHTKTN